MCALSEIRRRRRLSSHVTRCQVTGAAAAVRAAGTSRWERTGRLLATLGTQIVSCGGRQLPTPSLVLRTAVARR